MIKLFLSLNLLLFACNTAPKVTSTINSIDHSSWTVILQKHVSQNGTVNYKGFIEDKEFFEKYLQILSDNPPNKKTWSEDEQLAYWINAYNAFTVKLIIDNYPVKSIKDIKKGVPFVNSVWDIKFFKIGYQEMDLNEIEHDIIRTEFQEPRIHFAVNCASYSCPPLRNEAYTAERLDEQLTDQTRTFLTDTRKNNLSNSNAIVLSSLFKWYSTDFTNAGWWSRLFGGTDRTINLIKFITPYTDSSVTENTTIEFMNYDWSLNE